MKDLGEARSDLSLEVLCDCQTLTIYLWQAGKIHELVHDFNLADAKPVYTPMETGLQLPSLKHTADEDLKLPF
jgi:hypothetical protein